MTGYMNIYDKVAITKSLQVICVAKDIFTQGLLISPLKHIKSILGPDDSFPYPEAASDFEGRVNSMVESIASGWKPAPFIVARIWGDTFELCDGNHRAEALRRSGVSTYPMIFYFETETALRDFEELARQ